MKTVNPARNGARHPLLAGLVAVLALALGALILYTAQTPAYAREEQGTAPPAASGTVQASGTLTVTATRTRTATRTATQTATPTITPTPTPVPVMDWFKLQAEATADWSLVLDPNDAFQFSLTQKNTDGFTGKGGGQEPYQVFVLFSKKSSAFDVGLSRMLTVFNSKHILARFVAMSYNLNNDRAKELLVLAEAQNFDLIVAMGSESTVIAHDFYKNGKLPVVAAVAKDPVLLGQMPDYKSGSGTNIAYTSVAVPLDLQIAYLKRLNPNLKNIAVLYDINNVSAVESQVKPLQIAAVTSGLTLIDVGLTSKKVEDAAVEMETRIPAAVQQIAASDPTFQQSIFWVTGSTTVFNNLKTVNKYSGKVPVLSFSPSHVTGDEGSVVLSVGVLFESNAYLSALYCIDILQGTRKVGDLPVGVISPPDIAINFQKAREVGLRIPFSFFESASIIYDYTGVKVRENGQNLKRP